MESRLGRLAIDALFPRFCIGCEQEGTLWCSGCESAWWPAPFRVGCPFCGEKNALSRTCVSCREHTFLDGLMAFASYANPVVRSAIAQWKYVGDRSIERVLYGWLMRAVPIFSSSIGEAVFAPVPLHPQKRRARGFDQAGMLCDWLSELFNSPAHDLLSRAYATESQAGRERTQRKLGEFDNVFLVDRSLDFIPERVILCDDVFTSGTTMDSAAYALKQAGVQEVWGFVLAKGGI